MESGSTQTLYGKFLLILLEHNSIFLFKTYPTRTTDIDDLRTIVDKKELDEVRLISLLKEQDELYRKDFHNENLGYDPLRNDIELRARVSVSLHLMGNAYFNKVRRFGDFADKLFSEMELGMGHMEIAKALRVDLTDKPSVADLLDEEKIEDLRDSLSL